MSRKLRLALVSPYSATIIPFRGELIRSFIANNFDVYIFSPDYSIDIKNEICEIGGIPIDFYMKRVTVNPAEDLITLIDLVRLFKKYKIDLIFGYNHKPVIYSIIAGFISRIPNRFGLIEGLGYFFVEYDLTIKRQFIRYILSLLYMASAKLATKLFFLNVDDLATLSEKAKIPLNKAVILGGTGVDLNKWRMLNPYFEEITFTLAARLIREKGVLEFLDAAKHIKKNHPYIKFLLLGPLDTNPGAIKKIEIKRWVNEGVVEWPGNVHCIQDYLARTSVFVLPSYREGMPRSIQEAMASGRAIITTNVPGCRETVINGVNGFLIPPRNVSALIKAMEEFINNPSLITKMGIESRKIAEQKFDVYKINEIILKEILRNLSK